MKITCVLSFLFLLDFLCQAQQSKPIVYEWEMVQSASPDTIFGVTLERLKLDSIPAGLARFTELKYLNLGRNRLQELPTFIGDFTQLEVLDISRNKFAIFPIELCKLTELKELVANRNLFTRLPDCIGYCAKLERIDLWETPVATFPNSLYTLKELKELDLQGVRYNLKFQNELKQKLPAVKIKLDAPCNCL
jgi:hypothetical protein